jgi:hypothetical protein
MVLPADAGSASPWDLSALLDAARPAGIALRAPLSFLWPPADIAASVA